MTERNESNESAGQGRSDEKRAKKRRPLAVRVVFSLLRIAIVSYVGLAAVLFFFQSYFLYQPSREITLTPADGGMKYEDVTLVCKDATRLSAWYVPGEPDKEVVLFCHGNAGNISGRVYSLSIFHRLGLSVLIFDYRGYGESQGRPSESGTAEDARAAWDYLVNVRKIDPNRIVVAGRSLGGAVAAHLASERLPGALILEFTFTSVPDAAARLYPYLPVRPLCRYSYDTLSIIGQIRCPILIVAGKDDTMMGQSASRRLYEAAGEPKQFLELSGGHNDAIVKSEAVYSEGLERFLKTLRLLRQEPQGPADSQAAPGAR